MEEEQLPPRRPNTLHLVRPRPASVHSPILDFAGSLAETLMTSAAAEASTQRTPGVEHEGRHDGAATGAEASGSGAHCGSGVRMPGHDSDELKTMHSRAGVSASSPECSVKSNKACSFLNCLSAADSDDAATRFAIAVHNVPPLGRGASSSVSSSERADCPSSADSRVADRVAASGASPASCEGYRLKGSSCQTCTNAPTITDRLSVTRTADVSAASTSGDPRVTTGGATADLVTSVIPRRSRHSRTLSDQPSAARCVINKLGDAPLDSEPALFSLQPPASAASEPIHMTLQEVRRSVCEISTPPAAAASEEEPDSPPPADPPRPPHGASSARRPSLPVLSSSRTLRCAPLSPRRLLAGLSRVREDLRQLLTPRRSRASAAAAAEAAQARPASPPTQQDPAELPPVATPPLAIVDPDPDADEDADYMDDSAMDDLEMLGITEGWGPSPARPNPGPADFATIIEKVKDCGWYWGPISCSAAELVLRCEPDGSFIVRDSSDDRYIFSLTFKLRGLIRHARIEHNNGNFSFGRMHKFRSATIVDFIENAVEYSRSGRYLFFLHRRPAHGPMRVQLLHPVSRFKHIQSLKHLCRFVILKQIPRDHIDQLPLPESLKQYLRSPCYFSEQLEDRDT